MADTRDQTLTQVQSPLSPGEQRDRAVLLVSGNADDARPGRARAPADRRRRAVPRAARRRAARAGERRGAGRRAGLGPARAHRARLGRLRPRGSRQQERHLRRQRARRGPARGCATARWSSSATTSACSGWCRRSSSRRSRPSWSRRSGRWRPRRPRWRWPAIGCAGWPPSEGELFIVGETGVGKEVYARAVHEASGRKGRFVAINCAAIPRELVESELFGYRAGAHSTAHQAKAGLIEEAEGGTLFLDEIGEMTPRGADQDPALPAGPRADAARVDAAAAHGRAHHRRDQPHRRRPGQGPRGLRDDIVARLGAAPIHLPPLRNRIEDLGALIAHFLAGVPAQGPRFEQPAFRALSLHAWPLNVRELEKIVTTAAVLTGGKPIALRDLPEPIARVLSAPAAPGRAPLHRPVADAGAARGAAAPLRGQRRRRVARARQAPRRRLALDQEVRPRPAEVPPQRIGWHRRC